MKFNQFISYYQSKNFINKKLRPEKKFRLLDYVILLHAAKLDMVLKGLVSFCSQKSSFLVGKVYLRKTDAFNYNKK